MRTSGTPTRPLTPPTDDAITFGVLGPLEVRHGGTPMDVRGPQERALLALLLTSPGRVFSVSAIVAGMWGDDPPRGADKTVQSYVSRLRRALPPGAATVLTRSPGYLASVDPERVDAQRFRILAAVGRQELAGGDPSAAATTLAEALRLWRGEAYAEFDAPFAHAERLALDELRLAATEDRVAADLGAGAGAELVVELESLVAQHPWRERLWAQLMTALYRSGRQGDALRAFQRARRSLVDELGVEPGHDLQAVEALVLAQDTGLLGVLGPPDQLPRDLTFVGPPFVGRNAELARLLDAFDRTRAGAAVRVLVTGPHGMGKTRLLAQLAHEVQARGGRVVDRVPSSDTSRRQTAGALLVVLDDLQQMSAEDLAGLARSVVSAPAPLLVVGACVGTALTGEQVAAVERVFRDRLVLAPLAREHIREVVRLYAPPEAVAEAVAAVDAAGGVPLQVHALASRYGEELASERVGAAAAGIPGPRRLLTSSREQVAEGVVDLQRIRLLRTAHAPDDSPMVVCPYKGLAFFDVDDAPYFFGRERLVAQLVARLVDARFLAVVGASGSGKSSVVRAGLVAAVRAGVLPGSEQWRCAVTTPTRPFPDLTAGQTGTDARTLLVVDQFEELFTALSPARQREYAEALTKVSGDDVSVVVAVRSDYYGHATVHHGLADLLAANHVLVGEMTVDELMQAVELPAAAAGLDLEPGLAETVAGDVAGEPGGLPLMSTALLSLWERRDGRHLSLATYRELGGVRTAVARLAEAAYGGLTANQQAVARRTLLRLAETGDGGEPVRRRVPIAEVAPDGDNDARAVLDTLAARRLLTVSESHAEVAHEALLREWPRLRGWLDDDEAGRRLRRHLAPAALAWQVNGDPGDLYRGSRLAGALDWQASHAADLTDTEHDFLRASRDAEGADALRRRRSIRRLRGLAAGLAAVLAMALVASWVAVEQRQQAARSSLSADVRALRAGALEEARWDRALLYAVQAQRFEPSDNSRAALLETVQRSPEATSILNAEQQLATVAVSDDGSKVAAGGAEGTVFIWDTASGERTHTIHDVTPLGEASSLDISPDGQSLALVGVADTEDGFIGQLVLTDLSQTPPSVRIVAGPEVSAARFAADGRTVVTVGTDGRVRYADTQSGDIERTLDVEVAASSTVALDGSPNRQFMAAADPDPEAAGQVSAWEVDSGRLVWSSVEPAGTAVSVSPDGSMVVLGHADGEVELVDVSPGGARTPVASPPGNGLVDVTWAPDGSRFAGATQERTVLVWDADTAQTTTVLRGHSGPVTQVAYAADGATVYASGDDGSVLAWDVTGTTGIAVGHGEPLPLATRDRHLLSADGSVATWYLEDGLVEVHELQEGRSFQVEVPVEGAAGGFIDPRGQFAGLIHVDPSTVRVIDVGSGALLPYTIELNHTNSYDATFSADGRTLLTAADRAVEVWDVRTGRPHPTAVGYEAANDVVWVGADETGRLGALSEHGGAIEVVDLFTGQLVATLDQPELAGRNFPPGPARFSPNGRWLVAGSPSGRVVVWDTQSWQLHRVSTTAVSDTMVFTPDSRFLVTGGAGTATVWNVQQGDAGAATLLVDPVRSSAGVSVATRDGGRTIVTLTDGTGLREWSVEPGRLVGHACQVAGRNLTGEEWAQVLPDRPYERTCPEHPAG